MFCKWQAAINIYTKKFLTFNVFKPSSTVDFGSFVAFGEQQNFLNLKLIEIVILWVYHTIPFGFNLFWQRLVITFQLFKLHCLAKDHWRGFRTRNAHMVHVVDLIRLKMVYTS